MNNTNELALAKKHSQILFGAVFQDKIYFGFECSDGWVGLVDGALGFFESHARSNGLNLRIVQVKEKFGKLRIYTRGGDDFVTFAATLAEIISAKLCECCGRAGAVSSEKGWLVARCDDHLGERYCEQFRLKPEEFSAYSQLCTEAIAAMLSLFGSDAVRWAQTPSIALNDIRPVEALGTMDGCREVSLLIKRLEYGVGV